MGLLEALGNDLAGFGGALAALIAGPEFSSQATEISHPRFTDTSSDLAVRHALANADVHNDAAIGLGWSAS